MRLAVIISLSCAASFPAFGQTQQFDRAQMCTVLVPPMLNFISQMTEIEGGFAKLYGSMTPEDRAAFAETKANGEALTKAATAYRSSFLQACADK